MFYVGRFGHVNGEGETLVYDWRAPVSNMYYEFELGEAYYEAIDKRFNGEIMRKRQLKIENGIPNVLAHVFKNEGLTHSQTLVPMMDEALRESGLSLSNIDYFAINAGPGSFTGVRIGVAALKGITALDDANCIPVSTLESMAYNYADADDATICAAMDARCNQAYAAAFNISNGQIARIFDDSALLIDDLYEKLETLKKNIYFCLKYTCKRVCFACM